MGLSQFDCLVLYCLKEQDFWAEGEKNKGFVSREWILMRSLKVFGYMCRGKYGNMVLCLFFPITHLCFLFIVCFGESK